ncbi:phenylalanine--tRNA ligase subunit beta [Flavobacterium agricola]|uniref:Phenylalanine--tRNA ligase beta subunit n=1 Tax=Flavobacterium agricola TaxID=2870839 RepID=A0ABY6M3P0_9FLAO|nr:phenylalanine--tRNA ligase subunit beta [Flavobacterium agricola]UYW02394.1 phenylalanine--tRNA ligase subunit beta [Flavobacterium agricola]
MRISYNWLKQFIKINKTSDEVSTILTDLGLEVEGIETYESLKGGLIGVVVGHVLTCEKHPNADKLNLTTVDLGDGNNPIQIVCGAPNVAQGQKVLVATIGTKLFDAEGNAFEIKKGKIRGEESNGMICSESELGLGSSHDGILVLPEDTAPGTLAQDLFEIELDEVFEIGLTPNRSDAMSHWGVARDLRAGLLQQGEVVKELVTPSVSKFNVEKRTLKMDIKVEDAKLAPRYCGVTISGIEVKESPSWLQNRLKAIGLTPKNNIVDVTNYVMHELGQPLHAFDASKIKGGKVIVKTLPAGTKFVTLDEVERTLHEDDLMICDEIGPLCLAGVFGGKHSAVNANTTQIFLESAYFDPVTVRKAAKRHGLSTDASFRFERGIDPSITEYALKHAALLIQEVAGGEITSDIEDLYPKKIEDHQVFLYFDHVDKLLGQEISKEVIKKILVSLDIKVNSVSEVGLGLTIPAYRVDVDREVDVIEEILRVYGFNNIETDTKISASMSRSARNEDFKIQNIIGDALASLGFNEMMANSLTSPEYVKLTEYLKEEENVKMLTPLSNDLSVMRQSMLFSALEAVSYNINRRSTDLKFFEFGKTYHKKGELFDQYVENKHLSLTVTGNTQTESWLNVAKPIDFFNFKGYVHGILARLGIEKTTAKPTENDIFAEGIALTLGRETIVSFGSVKKSILKAMDIKQQVFYADFNWDAILKVISTKIKVSDLPKTQEVRRDLALLLDDAVTFEQVYTTVKLTEKALLKNINLFDVYQGDKLPAGKKSYAISLTLQDAEKTLTDNQIEKIMGKIQYQLETQLGATLR